METFPLIAELRAAPLPQPLQKIAVHLYLNFYFNDEVERWELWESLNAFDKIKSNPHVKSKLAIGHIYKNLKSPLDGVGGGNSYGVKKWTGDDAQKIYQATCDLSTNYLYKDFYRAWPGPNSNTFIATIFKKSGLEISLPATAIGKDFTGVYPKFKIQKNQINISVLTTGIKVIKNSYWELHFAGLTIGYEKKPREWKLPYGKGLFPYTFQDEVVAR